MTFRELRIVFFEHEGSNMVRDISILRLCTSMLWCRYSNHHGTIQWTMFQECLFLSFIQKDRFLSWCSLSLSVDAKWGTERLFRQSNKELSWGKRNFCYLTHNMSFSASLLYIRPGTEHSARRCSALSYLQQGSNKPYYMGK